MEDRKIEYWDAEESEVLTHTEKDEAIESALDSMDGKISELPATITVKGYARMGLNLKDHDILSFLLERLDEDFGNPDDWTKPTEAMKEAEKAFLEVVEKEYKVWSCESITQEEVNVQEWILAHRPDWLEERETKEDRKL